MLIDSHAHLNFAAYQEDADEVIRRSFNNGVGMINIGTNLLTSQKAIDIAQQHEKGVWAAVGLHPINLDTGLVRVKKDPSETDEDHQPETFFDFERYRTLAKNPKVVAIGEIGLDYYWRPKTEKKKALFREKQKELFLQALSLAQELDLPVILHCRMAHQNLLEVLKSKIQNPCLAGRQAKPETTKENEFPTGQANSKSKIQNPKIRGVMHSFVGTKEELEAYLNLGFYIGYNGIIFKNIEGINFEELIKATPLDRISVETDCPYLAPPNISINQHNQRKSAFIRNEPLFVQYIAEKIAGIKNLSLAEISQITFQNAVNLFNLPPSSFLNQTRPSWLQLN